MTEPTGVPTISAARVREALLALEGTVIEDLHIPLPGDLRDISKAASLVSGVVEDRIPEMLNKARNETWDEHGEFHAYEFRRLTIGFPDIQLVERANPENFIFEMEAKSWYILSADPPTARFLTSAQAVREGTVLALVAWMLDGIVSGRPKLMRIHAADARALAAARDATWTTINPKTHRVVEPLNEPDTPRSLYKTQVLAQCLENDEWRSESDNFGKLHRIEDADILAFEKNVWALTAAGKPLSVWRKFFSEDTTKIAAKAPKKASAKATKNPDTASPDSRMLE